VCTKFDLVISVQAANALETLFARADEVIE
jgi:hypothetical protein